MRPHPRIRKTIKWGGLVICVSLTALLALSTSWDFRRVWWIQYQERSVGLTQGCITYDETVMPVTPDIFVLTPFWEAVRIDPPSISWRPRWTEEYGAVSMRLPLWFPLILVTIPTALAWRLDTLATRRAKLGACPTCSYSRTGLAPSAPCPECGDAAPQA